MVLPSSVSWTRSCTVFSSGLIQQCCIFSTLRNQAPLREIGSKDAVYPVSLNQNASVSLDADSLVGAVVTTADLVQALS
jgi:hypothetical protein